MVERHLPPGGAEVIMWTLLPLFNLRSRWSKWHRHWRNDVVGSAGYFVVKRWHKALAKGPFNDKLSRATRK